GGNGQGGAQSPAAPCRIRSKKKRKPDGHRERAEINENQDQSEVDRQRGGPFAPSADYKIDYDQCQTVEEICEEKNTAAMTGRRRRPLQNGKNGKQNNDGARIQDLPLEMATIGLMRCHWGLMRGDAIPPASVTSSYQRQRKRNTSGC